MKFIRKLLVLCLTLLLGFWLGTTRLLDGTTLGSWMNTIVSYLPDTEQLNHISMNVGESPLFNGSMQLDSERLSPQILSPDSFRTQETEVNYDLVEQTIIDRVNELRLDLSLSPLQSNDMLKAGAIIRAQETEEVFSHTRPDGTEPFTVLEEEGIHYPYQMVGENLGMATYYMEEVEMAELIFNGWVESEGHYENMIRPEYEEIGVGVHYDGEFLYATQLFGTPL